jgi:signal transduction histidine kinase
LLIATGNYDITHAIREVLQGEGVILKDAYTHRDTLYMVQQHRFNALLIDAAMYDRHSRENTLAALARLRNPLPRIAILTDGVNPELARDNAVATISDLSPDAVRAGIATALGGTLPMRASGHTVNFQDERRLEEMQTLFRVSKSLTEVLDLPEVLNRVVEAGRRLTNADEGMILMPDENPKEGEDDYLILRARVGIDLEKARNFRVRASDGYAAQVMKTGQPTLAGKQGPLKVKTQHFAQSLLYVPIIVKGRPIGVLGVNNTNKEDIFEFHQQELLVNLASYAAIAIENARIHEESVLRARELELLVNASQLINDSLVMDETIAHVTAQMKLVLDVSRAEVYQWDERANRLLKRGHALDGVWRPAQGRVFELPTLPHLKTAMELDQPTWTSDEQSEILFIPIRTGNKTVGALRGCYIRRPDEPPTTTLMARVRQMGLEVMASLFTSPHYTNPEPAQANMQRIGHMLGADWVELLLSSDRRPELHMLSQYGGGVWRAQPFPAIELRDHPDLLGCLRDQTPLEIYDGRATLIVPLVHRGDAWGLVRLIHNDPARVYGRREIEMARAVAGQAATGLENARLVSELEDSLRELKETQDRIVQTARLTAMGQLAAVVAHQINNPLTTIIVDAELLLMGEKPDTKYYKPLTAIHRAGRRASGVARRLLSIARPDDPNTPPEMIDVVDTVEGIIQLVGSHIERSSITIHTSLPEPGVKLPPVRAVKGQLDDVWLNLIINAHDALAEQPNAVIGVEVAHRPDEDTIVVKIWDNGPGIPEELREKIFAPFFTTKPPGEGTGLGLHICRQAIDAVNGRIEMESFTGKGTRFTITLPVAGQAQP